MTSETTAPEPVLYIEPADRQGIPVDVMVTLTGLLGAAYPDAQMSPARYGGRGFGLVLPGRPKRVSKKAARAAVVEPDEDGLEVGVIGWDGKNLSTSPPEELALHLAEVAYLWLTGMEGVVNYIEQSLPHPDHPQPLVFSIAWSAGQTPHELRQKAEKERDLLAQAMWDARGILGFDNDGDPTPAASINGWNGYREFAEQHVREATEARHDHDEALDEGSAAETKVRAALALHTKDYRSEGEEVHGINPVCSCGSPLWPCETGKALGVTE